MLADYLPIVLMFGLATLFIGGSIAASALLGPRKQETAAKVAPYECGIVPEHEPSARFPVRFYLVAMIFIIFDIEIIFLYPWAVQFDALGTYGLTVMVLFTVAVVVALAYLLSNGALDWGPVAKLKELEDKLVEMRSDARTSGSTIRRVGKGAVTSEEAA